ncbi:MAG: M28 family peptidase, partial [Planctomycetes bacterium]|nr:M28 family peptidase [Planctomycetota bacterium]
MERRQRIAGRWIGSRWDPTRAGIVLVLVGAIGLAQHGVSRRGDAPPDDAPPPRGSAPVSSPAHGHRGPDVAPGGAGPARFVEASYAAFRSERAMEIVRFVDQFYRAPGNDGFEKVIDRVIGELESLGFRPRDGSGPDRSTPPDGSTPPDERWLELEVIETALGHDAWTPVRAAIRAIAPDLEGETLLGFEAAPDVDRTMSPVYSPSGRATGRPCFQLADVEAGSILVTDQPLGFMIRRARARGAAAVLSSRIAPFNVDPTDRRRHLDAIAYTKVPVGTELLCFSISARAHARIRDLATTHPDLQITVEAESRLDARPLRTVVASIVGATRPQEAIAIACHVQEPGAVDNASGVGGFIEAMRSVVTAIRSDAMARPDRTISIIWGDEMAQSRVYLDHAERRTIAALSADMVGASTEQTGAIALLERDPDPGAVEPLPPDVHTPWGSTPVPADSLRPSGLSVVARCALIDVG